MSSKIVKRILFGLLAVLVLAYIVNRSRFTGDFNVFLEAAKVLSQGESPYGVWLYMSENVYLLYFYSPLWALLLIPLTKLPSMIPTLLWMLAGLFFLYKTWKLLRGYFNGFRLTKKQNTWFILLTITISIRLTLNNFETVQMTLFLLWAMLESLNLFKKNKYILGGLLLAFAINIKIIPIVIIPYLLYRKEYIGTRYTLIFSIVLLFLPSLVLGWNTNLELLADWWAVINPQQSGHLIETGMGVHSLTALVPSLLTVTEGGIPLKRNIFNLDLLTATYIVNFVRFMLVVGTLYFLRWPPFKVVKSNLHILKEVSFILILIPLIFPHQQKYAFYLALPAQYFIMYFIVFLFPLKNKKISKLKWNLIIAIMVISFVLITVSSDLFIGRAFSGITQHFKTITYGTLLLVSCLFLCSTSYLESELKRESDENT